MSAPTTTNSMKYVNLGKSGLKVSRIILASRKGLHTAYGDPKWESWILDEKASIEHIGHAYKRGINTFDTANMYSGGASEVVLGKALRTLNIPRENVVILTKVFFPLRRSRGNQVDDQNPFPNNSGLSRKHIMASVKASLERLQVDYIDVLQCHRFDYNTPIEETMEALHDVVKSGAVRYIGMSSCHAYQFHQMQNYAIANKLTPFISMQNFYNAAYREEEREMIPTLKLFGTGIIPWSPLSRGFLTRPYNVTSERQKTDAMFRDRNPEPDAARIEINRRIEEIARSRSLSMAQVALAWLLQSGVTAPIVGTTRIEAMDELIDAIHIELTPEEKKYIDEPYTPRPVIGHL